MVADMKVDKVAGMVPDMKVDKVDDMKVDMVSDFPSVSVSEPSQSVETTLRWPPWWLAWRCTWWPTWRWTRWPTWKSNLVRELVTGVG